MSSQAETPPVSTTTEASNETPAAVAEHRPFPWEFWRGPGELPRLRQDHRVALRSSYCPSGCRFDRHSADQPRFLRFDGEEAVLFEDRGPGAITRLWMTQGHRGRSIFLDPNIRLRLTLDDEPEPRLDLPLPALFDGSTPPFVAPLVADRTTASGGFVSHVPWTYRSSARITLVGAAKAKLWFQVHSHRLDPVEGSPPPGLKSFDGGEDLSGLIQRLEAPGADPWGDDPVLEAPSGQASLAPRQSVRLAELQGPGLLTGLRLDAPREAWPQLTLRLTFDGTTTVDQPLDRLFAQGRGGPLPTRSLFVGLDADERLYLYFPMPFFTTARVELARAQGIAAGDRSAGDPAVEVGWWLRRSRTPPAEDSGLFTVRHESWPTNTPRRDLPLVRIDGAGKWVGLFAELGSRGKQATAGRPAGPILQTFLEGDERIYLDGSREPVLHGTGVEDFFGAGFYFDQGPFRRALHGMSYDLEDELGRVTAAYRLMPAAAPVFAERLDARLEAGPVGATPMRLAAVAYLYWRPPSPDEP